MSKEMLKEITEKVEQAILDILPMIPNPPYLAPKGCFKGEQRVHQGTIIEYNSALMPNAPTAVRYTDDLKILFEMLVYLRGVQNDR